MPDGSRSFSAYAMFVQGNQSANFSPIVQGAKLDASLGQLQYIQTFALAGQQVQAFGILPFGRVKGTVTQPGGTISAASSGLGDATIGAMVGLIGAPALPEKQYAVYQPGFTLGTYAKIVMPTGDYDATSAINLGANRWALQLGVPLDQYFGKSMLDASLVSLELTPSVTFFTTNNDPHNANTLKQAPIAKLEGHVTRNIGTAFWVSADAYLTRGGETTTDGAKDGNSQRWLNLGISAGITFSDTMSGGIAYGKVVRHNNDGLEARALRANVVLAF